MKNFEDLIAQAVNEPAFGRLLQMPTPLRVMLTWGITSSSSVADIEKRLEFMLVQAEVGWFTRRRMKAEAMADVKTLLHPEMVDATLASLSCTALSLIAEVYEALPKTERLEVLPRLIANVRAEAGETVTKFTLSDVHALLQDADAALAHDERTVEKKAEGVTEIYEASLLRKIALGISRALKDENGEMSTRRQRVYWAVTAGFGMRLGDDDEGESGCPNCGSESYEVTERTDLGQISKPTEFKESTTRGTRTKVMKVSYDRTRESRRCADCCFEWKFVSKVEQ